MALSGLHKPKRGLAGMTLIELMVVVTIVGILAAIAYPSYLSQTRKSRRTEARTALLDLAAREERYFATNSIYTSSPANLGYAGSSFPVNVGSNYYQITACVSATAAIGACTDAGTGAAFLLTATPINDQQKDSTCGTLTMDATGAQAASGSAGTTICWN